MQPSNYSFYAVEKGESATGSSSSSTRRSRPRSPSSPLWPRSCTSGARRRCTRPPSPWKSASSACAAPSVRWPEAGLKMQFSSWEFNGDELFTVEDVSKSFGGRTLFDREPGSPRRRAHRPAGGQWHRQDHLFENPAGGRAARQGVDSLRPHRPQGLPAPDRQFEGRAGGLLDTML